MKILGLTVTTHDTSAALFVNSELKIAIEEERLIREKHTFKFPQNAIETCLNHESINIDELDCISICWNLNKILIERYMKKIFDSDFNGLVQDRRSEIERLIEIEDKLKNMGYNGIIEFNDHYDCHTIYSFYSSNFNNCAFLTLDGFGEIESGRIGCVKDGNMEIWKSYSIENSLGLFYSAFTDFLGFKTNYDEGIVMGLSAYGDSTQTIPGKGITYEDLFKDMIILENDKQFYHINREYFLYGLRRVGWVSEKLREYLGEPRGKNEKINDHYKNIANALQKRIEETLAHLSNKLYSKYGLKNMCISGGLGLNCVANGKLLINTKFEDIHIPCAPADNGLSIGAGLVSLKKRGSIKKISPSAYLGPIYENRVIEKSMLELLDIKISRENIGNDYSKIANLIQDGKIVAIFHGRSEFGPRALGNRSIIAKPFPVEMKDYVNKQVKFREEFCPFAPAILEEYSDQYFEIKGESNNMIKTFQVKPEKIKAIEAVVHVDGTGRVQTVSEKLYNNFYLIIKSFYDLTGVPVIMNTSFNVKGQPIVETPEEAIKTFLSTKIEALLLGKYLIIK